MDIASDLGQSHLNIFRSLMVRQDFAEPAASSNSRFDTLRFKFSFFILTYLESFLVAVTVILF